MFLLLSYIPSLNHGKYAVDIIQPTVASAAEFALTVKVILVVIAGVAEVIEVSARESVHTFA